MRSASLERYAWYSVAAALVTIALKTLAWRLTGSVGLLSDALESLINLAAALLALSMLRLAASPPDAAHPYGRYKAEYFASGIEGALIVFTAVAIAYAAVPRLASPQPIEAPLLGIALSALASAINLGCGRMLISAGRRLDSIALEADGHHLMTDVWTSVGIIVGVALVAATGWHLLDPLIALAVAAHIVFTGLMLMRRSLDGLLDAAIPPAELAEIENIFTEYRQRYGVEFHALLTRQAGARRFISFHLLVPDAWPVDRAHQLSEEIEERIRARLPNAITLSHIEPISQPASYDDIKLERW
ncbi:MAG: cation transporter [Betaproteobacteria bacterium]|nr:cation transporter [Betaproteobacteria bacterium]MSQ89165.1 cation transporter [Betaproteobacteria bacterium]